MRRRKIFSTDVFGRSLDPRNRDYERTSIHSRFFERYFSGYELREVPKNNGKGTRIVREYTGVLYQQELPESKCRQLRLRYLLSCTVSIGLFLISLMFKVKSNSCWYVMLCMLIPMTFYIWLAVVLTAYLPSKRNLKEHEYLDGALRIVKVCRLTVCGMGLMVVTTTLMFILEPGSFSAMETVRLGILAVSSLLLLNVAKIESKIKYSQVIRRKEEGSQL